MREYFSNLMDVTCRDLSTNAIKWTAHLTDYNVGAPVTTNNGLVIVLTRDGQLTGLDATTGKRAFIRTLVPYGPYRDGTVSVGDGVLVAPSGEAVALLR